MLKNFVLILLVLIVGAGKSYSHDKSCSGKWINPRLLVGNPAIARLQQGRTELTAREKKDIRQYGYTGLELITYLFINTFPGRKTWDTFEKVVKVTSGGQLKIYSWLWKEKYYFKNPLCLLTYDGIKPCDLIKKYTGIYFVPPERKYRGFLYYEYLTSRENHLKDKEGWAWIHELRRYRRSPTTAKDDYWLGSVLTYDDMFLRRPWEEKHRIIGEDKINGQDCFVVESRSLKKTYYLFKRVTWVEKRSFLDLHQEQFDRGKRRSLVIDILWEQIEPTNYRVRSIWNCVNFVTKRRIVRNSYNWRIDPGFDDGEFLPAAMGKEYIWKKPPEIPAIEDVSDLPPPPVVRTQFWENLNKERSGEDFF